MQTESPKPAKQSSVRSFIRTVVGWLFYQRKRTFTAETFGVRQFEEESYTRHLFPTWFQIVLGALGLVFLFAFYPGIVYFTIAVLLSGGSAATISQIIVLGVVIALYISARSLVSIYREYEMLDDVVRSIIGNDFHEKDFLAYFKTYQTFSVGSRESLIENKLRAIIVSGSEDPTAVTDLQIVRIQAKHSIVAFIANTAPLVGLAGTLLGLSVAVSGMQGIVGTLGNTGGLTDNLDVALSGMSGAFFTTLFGIAGMILLRYYNLVVENAEHALLTIVNEAVQFRILPVLRERGIILE